ncbi:MAG: sulfurtransferase TusA family protein [Bifidobacteriaceae bacterium]|jgi:TusA-related sulfurtransferase|nr:sulfurtransferase TusA family protein [Bifidobacteriaceae bacterium]
METVLDTRGKVCPFPLVEAKQAIAGIEPGDTLTVAFDCTQGTESLPRWAVESGHRVTSYEQTASAEWAISIQKG